jgi:DNA-binding HxlR family transcriptional regulator
MKRTAITDSCPMGLALSVLAGKWKSGILCALLAEHPHPLRFSELRRIATTKALSPAARPMSRKVLSSELQELEQHGIVFRQLAPGSALKPPLNVQYGLTVLGTALRPAADALLSWGAALRALTRSGVDAGKNGPAETNR